MTFTLSADERRILADALPNDREDLDARDEWLEDPKDADWLRIEAALGQILSARGSAALDTGHWVTAGNTDYELHGKPTPPVSIVLNITDPPTGPNLLGALGRAIETERFHHRRTRRSW